MSFMEPPVRSQQKLWQRGEGSRTKRRRERSRLSAIGRKERTLGIPRGGVRASLARRAHPVGGGISYQPRRLEVAVGLLGW